MANGAVSYDLADIDRQLKSFEQTFAVLAKNLDELKAEVVFQLLTPGKGNSLKGKTAAEVVPRIEEFLELEDRRYEVDALLGKARQMRDTLPAFGRAEKINELGALLHGDSIELPVIIVPLQQRKASTPAEVKQGQSIQDWLDKTSFAFETVNSFVQTISDIWTDERPKILDWQSECSNLIKLAAELGEPQQNELMEAQSAIARCLEEIDGDPLSFSDVRTVEIKPHIDAAKVALEKLKKGRDGLLGEIRLAVNSLKELQTGYKNAQTVIIERRLKVSDAKEPPALFDAKVISDLADWLLRIKSTAEKGQWRSCLIGMNNLKAQIAQRLTQLNESTAGNQKLLD
jgi:hypothetical protein